MSRVQVNRMGTAVDFDVDPLGVAERKGDRGPDVPGPSKKGTKSQESSVDAVFAETLGVLDRFARTVLGKAGVQTKEYSPWITASGISPSAVTVSKGMKSTEFYQNTHTDLHLIKDALVHAVYADENDRHGSPEPPSVTRARKKYTDKIQDVFLPYPFISRNAMSGYRSSLQSVPNPATAVAMSITTFGPDQFAQKKPGASNAKGKGATGGGEGGDGGEAASKPEIPAVAGITQDASTRVVKEVHVIAWRSINRNLLSMIDDTVLSACLNSALGQIQMQCRQKELCLWECMYTEGTVFYANFTALCAMYMRISMNRATGSSESIPSASELALASSWYFSGTYVDDNDGTIRNVNDPS